MAHAQTAMESLYFKVTKYVIVKHTPTRGFRKRGEWLSTHLTCIVLLHKLLIWLLFATQMRLSEEG